MANWLNNRKERFPLTIYKQIKSALNENRGDILSSKDIKDKLIKRFNTHKNSIILSDYCYNRYNKGIVFNQHLFIYIDRSTYKYVGENYPYTGFIFQKSKGSEYESVVGEWNNGRFHFYPEGQNLKRVKTGTSLIKKLYEEYFEILRFEINVLGSKATEARHLVGRLGEFFCVLYTNGELAKMTNQPGYDVIKNGRRISVKTTAQDHGFIRINKNTFDQFDDLFAVQYKDDDFQLLFYRSKKTSPYLQYMIMDMKSISIS